MDKVQAVTLKCQMVDQLWDTMKNGRTSGKSCFNIPFLHTVRGAYEATEEGSSVRRLFAATTYWRRFMLRNIEVDLKDLQEDCKDTPDLLFDLFKEAMLHRRFDKKDPFNTGMSANFYEQSMLQEKS